MSHDAQTSEGPLRLRATVRALFSPGIWFVLAVQMAVAFTLRRHLPEDASSAISALTTFLTASVLLGFYYLQGGAFHALTLSRDALAVVGVIRAGREVFASFVWLTLKAGLLLAVIMNALILGAMVITGHDIKTLVTLLAPFFDFAMGLMMFIFVFWLPIVFVRREFHLIPSLKAALQIAWMRLPRSAFLALLVLTPVWAPALLPAESPALLDVLVSLIGGFMGWIAYIYCVEVLQALPVDGVQDTA
jgi:hypothetical protein